MRGGYRRGSSFPTKDVDVRAEGRMFRGVVVATYVPGSGESQVVQGFPTTTVRHVYCDVLVYSRLPTYHGSVLTNVLVAQDMGMHDGRLWIPRAATVDISGNPLDLSTSDPHALDGDHVLVGFLEDDWSKPIVLGRMPHPRMGLGNEELTDVGHSMRANVSDGQPDFRKHRGAYYGVDADGNVFIDATRAHDGAYTSEGKETPKDEAGYGGVTIRANREESFTVVGVNSDNSDEGFRSALSSGDANLRLDDLQQINVHADGADTVVTVNRDAAGAVVVRTTPTGETYVDAPRPSGLMRVSVGSDGSFEVRGVDANNNNETFRMTLSNNSLVVRLRNGLTLQLADPGSEATLQLGDGARKVAIADELAALYGDVKIAHDTHTHAETAVRSAISTIAATIDVLLGGTGTYITTISGILAVPPDATTTQAPLWDAKIESTHLTLPESTNP